MPTIRNYTTTYVASGTSVSVAMPTGTVVGDLLYLFTAGFFTPTNPAGWTNSNTSTGTNINGLAAKKYATAGDISAGTVSVTYTGGTGEIEAVLVAVDNGNITLRGGAFARAATASGSVAVSAGTVAVADLGLYFGTVRSSTGSRTIGITRGTADLARADTTLGVFVGHETFTAAGAVSQSFTSALTGTVGYYYGAISVRNLRTTVVAPPADVDIAVQPAVILNWLPAGTELDTPAPDVARGYTWTPGDVLLAAGAEVTRVARSLYSPDDQAAVPVLRPVFAVMVNMLDGILGTVTVDVQYDDNTAFAGPTTVSTDTDLVFGNNLIRLPASGDLAPGGYFWRARLTIGGYPMGWTGYRHLTVDPSVGDATAPAVWTVIAGPTDPRLWYITPAAGQPGTEVTLVGQGFSMTEGTVTVADTPMTVQSWRHIAATAAATTADRTIDPDTGVVDPEHDEIVVIVPDDAPEPGGPLIITDGS